MYKNRKFKNTTRKSSEKPAVSELLRTIDENDTIKVPNRPVCDPSQSLTRQKSSSSHDEDIFGGDERVPLSQEQQSQRYLSQRSGIFSRTQSKTHRANTYFELLLIKAGVDLEEADSLVLSCDHIVFVSKFRDILMKSQDYPRNLDKFKSGLKDALKESNTSRPSLALKLLCGCTINIPGESNVYQSQNSFIFNFLMIDFLKDIVVDVLLEKISEYSQKETTVADESMPMLPLLLSQLRYVARSHSSVIFPKIKEIFNLAPNPSKFEIIEYAEMILDSIDHNNFVQMLLNTFSSNKDLFQSTTIRTLTNLTLSDKMQTNLQQRIMEFVREGDCSKAIVPLLIKFLLKVLNDDAGDLRDLVDSLREILLTLSTTTTEIHESLNDAFHFIHHGFARSKKFIDAWQKYIQSLPPNKFRSIDIVILLGMININEERASYIENLICRRIKNEEITAKILKEAKSLFSPILESYTNVLMQILSNFLKSKYKLVTEFASCSFGILFSVSRSMQKVILRKLVDLTCDKSAHKLVSLQLLKNLNGKHLSEVQDWAMMFMPLFDRINEMSLTETRIVMELLCSIAYPAPDFAGCSTLQDEIEMMVKKQIINAAPLVKKQGIIGAVQLIDSVARTESPDQERLIDNDKSFSNFSELPDGRGKEAASFIIRVHSATIHCAESLALFCDELADICLKKKGLRFYDLDQNFIIYLSDLVTDNFQNAFIVTENLPETSLSLPVSFQKCINFPEDTNTEESELPNIAINISGLVLNPQPEAMNSVLVLAPMFDLMRALNVVRHKGCLDAINALLGCAIILPTFFDQKNGNLDIIFYDYDERMCKKILDIYFHTINWIREIVSAFSMEEEAMIRSKILRRLKDLIEIEGTYRHLLTKAPADYAPPICQFSKSPSKPVISKQTSRKVPKNNPKKANETISNSMTETRANETNNQLKNKAKCSIRDGYSSRESYRQMSSTIMFILQAKLDITYPFPDEEIGKCIGLVEFSFILSDIVNKLESVIGTRKTNSMPAEQCHQHSLANIADFIIDLKRFLPRVIENMELIGESITTSLEKVSFAYGNTDLFTEEFNYKKVCFGLCLKLFVEFFSWYEFSDELRNDLLRESLLSLMGNSQQGNCADKKIPELAHIAFEKYSKLENIVLDLKSAVNLYHLLLSLRKYSSENINQEDDFITNQKHQIRSLCKLFLCRKWYNYDGTLEKGAACNESLVELVKGFLENSDFNRQKEILKVLLEETQALSPKDGGLRSFPNFKKSNFPLLFRLLCEELINSLNNKITLNYPTSSDSLKVWEKSCEILNALLLIVKSLDLPRNFSLFLKFAHIYLKLVMQHGLPVFEKYLAKNPERVNTLLHDLQITTRFLHNLCCHSKALKKTEIIVQIPNLRQTIENLVFRVFALLAANKCSSAFWMGNLKNKDIHGDDILSQCASSFTISAQDESNDEEDCCDDDLSPAETILDNDNNSTNVNAGSSSRRSKHF